MTLKEKLENALGDWLCRQGLSISDGDCDELINEIMLEIEKEKK